jgi:hydroxyacylglutathione hydrolase
MFEIDKITTDIFAENIYIVTNTNNKKTIIIDPGEIKFEKINNYLGERGLKVVAILNTHAHPDHIARVKDIQTYYKIPFFLHQYEKDFLEEFENLGNMIGFPDFSMPNDISFIEAGTFIYDSFEFVIYLTPGHTKGSICIEVSDYLLSGDTLFKGSIGRIDLPGGSMDDMRNTIEQLKKLNHSLTVFPGHGESTTIIEEISNNPYF